MAVHELSAGKLLVCHWCQAGDCADSPVHRTEYLVCHCSKCQPPCERPECAPLRGGAGIPPGEGGA